MNDCVPTSYAEANDFFGGNKTYEEYLTHTGYAEDVGVSTSRRIYERRLSEEFTGYGLYNPSEQLKNIDAIRAIKNDGGLIHTNMTYSSIRHADNLRSIKYFRSGKVLMKFRIGSYRLSSVDNNWWFYVLTGIR